MVIKKRFDEGNCLGGFETRPYGEQATTQETFHNHVRMQQDRAHSSARAGPSDQFLLDRLSRPP